MLHSIDTLEDVDHDSLISSYGFVEEVNNNNAFLYNTLQIAMELTHSSHSYISLLDSKQQQVLTVDGIVTGPIPRNESVCQYTVKNRVPTIFNNLKTNELTKDLSFSQGPYKFYSGFPLINSEHIVIGALCVLDEDAKEISDKDFKILELLAAQIINRLDTNRSLIQLIKGINKNFKPAECANFHCLRSELTHLQKEVIHTNEILQVQSKELNKSNKNLENFAHRVAHDLKSPLRSISSFAGLIRKNLDRDEIVYKKDHFDFINNAALEMKRTIENLLLIAKIKADSIKQESFSLLEILDSFEILFYADLINYKVTFIKPTNDIVITSYYSLIKQLFQNLISNGIKYRDEAKQSYVKVVIESNPTSSKISVIDNGIGISADQLEDIFQPFKRVNENSNVEGMGIGLDTCKMIVDDMGSTMNVESAIGIGSTFSFELKTH